MRQRVVVSMLARFSEESTDQAGISERNQEPSLHSVQSLYGFGSGPCVGCLWVEGFLSVRFLKFFPEPHLSPLVKGR